MSQCSTSVTRKGSGTLYHVTTSQPQLSDSVIKHCHDLFDHSVINAILPLTSLLPQLILRRRGRAQGCRPAGCGGKGEEAGCGAGGSGGDGTAGGQGGVGQHSEGGCSGGGGAGGSAAVAAVTAEREAKETLVNTAKAAVAAVDAVDPSSGILSSLGDAVAPHGWLVVNSGRGWGT